MASSYHIFQGRFRFYSKFISELLYARVMWTCPSVTHMNFMNYEFLRGRFLNYSHHLTIFLIKKAKNKPFLQIISSLSNFSNNTPVRQVPDSVIGVWASRFGNQADPWLNITPELDLGYGEHVHQSLPVAASSTAKLGCEIYFVSVWHTLDPQEMWLMAHSPLI